MHDYDVTLKRLFRSSAQQTLAQLTGKVIEKWLPVELPQVRNLRIDLLGEAHDGTLIQIELQSTNDAHIQKRMFKYCEAVYDLYDRIPWQIVLYVGEAKLRMPHEIREGRVVLVYDLVDIRTLDGKRLRESEGLGDNVIAILSRMRHRDKAVREIIGRIAERTGSQRQEALEELLLLAGLRKRLAGLVREEVRKMPLEINILENEVLGPVFKKGLEKGRKEGRKEGREEGREVGLQQGEQKGRQEGELAILRRLMEKRFGALPAWAAEWLASRSTAELEEISVRLLDAATIEELRK
jgi:predicted transposase YdaD